jgi:hypothetical protein
MWVYHLCFLYFPCCAHWAALGSVAGARGGPGKSHMQWWASPSACSVSFPTAAHMCLRLLSSLRVGAVRQHAGHDQAYVHGYLRSWVLLPTRQCGSPAGQVRLGRRVLPLRFRVRAHAWPCCCVLLLLLRYLL